MSVIALIQLRVHAALVARPRHQLRVPALHVRTVGEIDLGKVAAYLSEIEAANATEHGSYRVNQILATAKTDGSLEKNSQTWLKQPLPADL